MYRNKICGVYLITNNLNGMSYVGQSTDCMIRWCNHKTPSANRLIDLAIKEFGIENFTFKIEKECLPEELDYYERETIKKYNTLFPNGYNRATGGKRGFDVCEESKRQNSESSKGKNTGPKTEEHRRKLSESMKGRKPWNKGKKMGPAWNKGKKMGPAWNKGVALSKQKWLTPSGEIRIMDKWNARYYHPDWVLYTGDQT